MALNVIYIDRANNVCHFWVTSVKIQWFRYMTYKYTLQLICHFNQKRPNEMPLNREGLFPLYQPYVSFCIDHDNVGCSYTDWAHNALFVFFEKIKECVLCVQSLGGDSNINTKMPGYVCP